MRGLPIILKKKDGACSYMWLTHIAFSYKSTVYGSISEQCGASYGRYSISPGPLHDKYSTCTMTYPLIVLCIDPH